MSICNVVIYKGADSVKLPGKSVDSVKLPGKRVHSVKQLGNVNKLTKEFIKKPK